MKFIVFPMCMHFILFFFLFTRISESKDTGSTAQNVPVGENVGVKKHHSHHVDLSFDKEKTLVPTSRVLGLIDGSGSGEDKTEVSVVISSSSGEESTSFETVEHSGYVERQNLEGSTEGEDGLGVETSGSGSGYGSGEDSTEKKLKGVVEEEETTIETTGRESGNLSSSTAEMDKLLTVTPYAKIHSPTTPTTQTLTEKITKGDNLFPITKKVTTDPTSEVKCPSTSVEKPTNFLRVLQEIRRELDDLLEWKEAHVRKVYEVARRIGEVFKQERSFTPSDQADKKKDLRQNGRKKRSNDEEESGLSKEILRKIEKSFPCRHPQTMMVIKSGDSFFNQQDCLECQCHMGKLSCEKDLGKCYPKACHLLNGDVVPNLAIHNDGCNNCLCHFGKLICTRLRCPEAGHRYTNYKANGLENVEPEDHTELEEIPARNSDACLECDHLPGPYVCGKKQWKTYPSLCHAMFCGENQDEDIQERSCEFLDPCLSSPCGKDEKCIPYYQTPCLAGGKTKLLCQQYKCISSSLKCLNSPTTTKVCGMDGQSYSNECEVFFKGVQLAYEGPCKKKCNSEVCGIESRTFASHCHASELHAYVDYHGHCEYHFTAPLIQESSMGESSFMDQRCDLVYEHGQCLPTKCEKAVLPPGACCPVCGAAVVVSLNLASLNEDRDSLRLGQMYAFVVNLQDDISPQLCKVSVDLTYSMDILIVVRPYKINKLDACRSMAAEIVDKINFERDDKETGILAVLGSATMVEETAVEIIDKGEHLV